MQAKITGNEIKRLQGIARDIRVLIIKMLTEAGSGHPGGSLSIVEILTALYFYQMNHNPQDPNRDPFVLSKGHAVPALYAAFVKAGYLNEEEIYTLRKINSRIQGHPDHVRFPMLETSAGSLGLGLSIAQGMALAAHIDHKNYKVYCLIGDGESQEGQIWEAAMSAPKFKLENLVCILDYNKGQIDGPVEDIMDIEPIAQKWKSFNWNVLEIDGHNLHDIILALNQADHSHGKPTCIIAHTVKGKGVPFMEGVIDWHGKAPSQEEAQRALSEILSHE
ncbi:MAG: transketolase [Deltaproteobacteria bacterium]|nr:transketolase [Deltaproteobacteria bacterium]